MPRYLVRVHDAPRNTSVTVVHGVAEYEIEAGSLREACTMVFDQPVRTQPPVERKFGQNPGHRDYVEPPRSRFEAVADFAAGSAASMEAGIARAMDEVIARRTAARRLGREAALTVERDTILDCVTLDDGWDDPAADHAAEFEDWVTNKWHDEEVEGRSWFHGLHEALVKAGVDGASERGHAEKAYWEAVREVVAEANADRAPAPGA